MEQIGEMEKWEGGQLNQAKEILAFELTRDVHGEEEAVKAQEAARALCKKSRFPPSEQKTRKAWLREPYMKICIDER